jgi:hypothetical protein
MQHEHLISGCCLQQYAFEWPATVYGMCLTVQCSGGFEVPALLASDASALTCAPLLQVVHFDCTQIFWP